MTLGGATLQVLHFLCIVVGCILLIRFVRRVEFYGFVELEEDMVEA